MTLIFELNPVDYRGRRLTPEQLKDEYLHGWCPIFQQTLIKKLNAGERYVIYEKTSFTEDEYYDDHEVVKCNEFYIDIRGIFTEKDMLEEHKKEYRIQEDDPDAEIDCYLNPSSGVEEDYNEEMTELLDLTEKIVDALLVDIRKYLNL